MDIRVVLTAALTLLSTQADICLDGQHCSNCSSSTKYCFTDCHPGYYDLKCKSRCSKNCKNRECSQDLNGVPICSQGCVLGFYGTQCNIPYPSPMGNCTKCPHGCDGQFCHLNSSCVSGCPDLYYGSNCKMCSHRCRSCNRITGRCEECHDPYSGQNCQFSCENCLTIDCVQMCAPGLYGHKCTKKCSNNCQTYPAANSSLTNTSSNVCISECQRQSGECINGCLGDWFGPSCTSEVKCNLSCMGCNESVSCVEGCLSGYYGDDCKSCPENCFNHTCHPKNGSCNTGCIRGYYGQFCTESCRDCPGGACHQSTGICAEHEVSGQGSIIGATIGTSTALVIFICGVAVTVLCVHCKTGDRMPNGVESMHTEGSRQEERLEYYTLHRYWEIDDYDEASHPQAQQGRAGEEDYDEASHPQAQQGRAVEEDYDEASHPQAQQGRAGEEDYDEASHPQAQQGRAGEEDYDEASQRQGQQQGRAEEEGDSSDSTAPVLADYIPGVQHIENDKGDPEHPVSVDYIPRKRHTEGKRGASALALLADNFSGALNTEDKSDDTSRSTASGYHPFRDVFVDDPRTVVTYITPTEDSNQRETGTDSPNL